MYFIFLFLKCISSHVLAIDLGSEYYKMAQSTISGEPKMVLNSNSVVSTPTAIAFKSSRNITKPITPEEVFKYLIKFGDQAIPLLKRNSTLGFRYLNRVIGRFSHNKTEFHTCPLANTTELLAISLFNYIGKTPYTDGLTFTIPQFWTNEQRRVISQACEIAGLNILTIIDDFSAISILYGSLRNNKYRRKPKHVMFIDVGSTSTKVYSGVFHWNKNSSSVRQTAISWTEKCGGYFLAKEYANNKKVSISKATKILQNSSPSDVISHIGSTLDELKKVVTEALELSNDKEGPIDEIQLTGGASNFKFVVDVILATTNQSKVSRDFNSNEAFALGAVIASLHTTDMSIYPPVYIHRLPAFSMAAICGDTIPYCLKNEGCDEIIMSNSTGCDVVNLYSPDYEIPEGTLPLMAEYDLVNISKLKIDPSREFEAHGFIKMKHPDALIDSVRWCSSENKCKNINIKTHFSRATEHEESKRWAGCYLDIVRSRERKLKLIEKVDKQINTLKKLLLPGLETGPGNVFPIPENLKEVFNDRFNEFKSGKMHNMDEGEVSGALEDLEDITKAIADQL